MDIKKRIEAQKKSRELGRCICSTKSFPFPCPCKFFIDKKICHCSGEEHEGVSQEEWAKYNINHK